ncbi:hypothetical protein GGI15_003172 [Coemansia interrupta]|uniref:Nuclear pore complex protein Nup205 n=1 Tax=Coemansia interrupta TaxID=1126814 RepID=A0A9W8LIP0_9FUNG|nr:hypothetical protein GGI15_003172 [Coemansia interrupta]
MANTTWEPERFSNLNKLLEKCLDLTDDSPTFEKLTQQLGKSKTDLAGLFEYPGKSAQHRSELEKGTPSINGEKFKVSSDFVTEAKKLSDFLDIDENIAAALVQKAVPFEKRFELPAAETAVLLFFSEREAKIMCLNTLFTSSASKNVDASVRTVLEKATGDIMSSAMTSGSVMFPSRVLSTITELKTKQTKIKSILDGPTADIPYQREVVEFVQTKLGEERKQLAMLLFVIVRDHQLNCTEMISVVEWLRSSSVDDPVTLRMALTILRALETACDNSSQEMAEAAARNKISLLVQDAQFLVKLNAEIIDKTWSDDGMKGLVWLQWALLVLFGIKNSPGFDHMIGYREDRVEKIAEQAIQMGAYRFAVDYMLGYRISDDTDYELSTEFEVLGRQRTPPPSTDAKVQRYPHFADVSEDLQWHIEHTLQNTVAMFIERMSSLIRSIRYKEEDAIYQAQQAEIQRAAQEEQRQLLFQQQQQQQLLQTGYRYSRPINNQAAPGGMATSVAAGPEPRRDTEALFLWITVLYNDRPDSSLRFWDIQSDGRVERDDRLAVFLRWGSDCREQGMIRGYFNMLSSLACGPQASVCAYQFMRADEGNPMGPSRSQLASNQAPLCSWSALFGALDFYAGQMRQSEPDPLAAHPEIPDNEVPLLRAFLRLCRSVVRYSYDARINIYDSPEYNAVFTMFNLLGCTVPVSLKASIIDAISAFGDLSTEIGGSVELMSDDERQSVNEIARRSWELLEQSQTLPTTNDINALHQARPAGIQQVPMPKQVAHRSLTIGRGVGAGIGGSRPSPGRGGIIYELEENETAAETYPEVRAFVRLIISLIHPSTSAPALSNMERDPVLYSAASPSIPTSLGGLYRIPGISPYISFILDHVLLKAEQRAYRYPSEKWSVYALSLDAVERCLATMDLATLMSELGASGHQQQSGKRANSPSAATIQALVTHPGFEIAVRILCGSKLLDTLLHVLSVGVDTLNTATGDLGASIHAAVLSTMRILLRTLRVQDALLRTVIPVILESADILEFPLNLPRSITTLEQLLLSRRQSVVQIVSYIGCVVSPDVCLASVKILHILADSPVFNGVDDSMPTGSGMLTLNRLVGMIDSSVDSVRIMHGFISCLETDSDYSAESQVNELIGEAERGFTSGLDDQQTTVSAQSIRLAIIDLLLANLSPSKPAPTIAHYLLGFSLNKPASDDLPDPSQRATCMHSILDLLRKDEQGFELHDGQLSSILARSPRLAERCQHLIYHLCSDPVTSEVTMRYLRARENFFFAQISQTPATIVPDLQEVDSEDQVLSLYSPIRVYAQMHARAWLWRSAALELHTLVLQDSRSRAKLIAEWLVGDANQQADASVDGGSAFGMLSGKGTHGFLDSRMRILALFDSLRQAYRDSQTALSRLHHQIEREYLSGDAGALAMDEDIDEAAVCDPSSPAYFDTDILNVDISSCIVTNERGCSVYDLHALLALLEQSKRVLEINGELSAESARQRIFATIRRLIIRCYFANQERELFFAYACALRGWKEVAEITVTSAWDKIDVGGRVGRERTAFQLLRGIVQVIGEVDPVYRDQRNGSNSSVWWIDPPSAEQELRHTDLLAAMSSTLTLFTERLSSEWTRSGALTRASLAMNKPGVSGQSRQLPPAVDSKLPTEPLLDAWKMLVGAALTPAAQASLQLRGNVYASMLHFLGGVRKLAAAEAEDMPSMSSVGPQNRLSKNKLLAGALDVLANSTLGDRLLEAVSADAVDASDAWKTVAFSLLDALTTLYTAEARPNRVVQFLSRKNYLASFVGSILRREDQAIRTTLHADPASLNALYIYEAKMAFFLRLAQRQDGAERLMENGILDVLADCGFLDLKPSVGGDAGAKASYADAFIPARSERYHQLLMPALDLVLSLVTRIGRENLALWMKAARFVSQHYGVLESIIKDVSVAANPLSIALLTEAKAITSLVFYISRQRAVLDREAALASSGYVGVSSLHLSMLSLLPKFGTSSNWIKRLMPTNDVERAQAQIPASSVAAATPPDGNDDSNGSARSDSVARDIKRSLFGHQAGELVDGMVQNVLAYAQTVTELPKNVSPLEAARMFRPAFSWSIEHSRESDYLPSLATLVAFARRSLSQIERGRRARDEKMRLAKNSSEMTTADLRKLVASSPYVELSDDLNAAQMRALASVLLTQQAQRISRNTTMLVSAIEQALVLLWRHLSFFTSGMNDTVDSAHSPFDGGRAQPSLMAVPSAAERETLRSDASISLPPLLASLSELKFSDDELANAATHTSFVQMLVRRIKDMVLRDGSVI